MKHQLNCLEITPSVRMVRFAAIVAITAASALACGDDDATTDTPAAPSAGAGGSSTAGGGTAGTTGSGAAGSAGAVSGGAGEVGGAAGAAGTSNQATGDAGGSDAGAPRSSADIVGDRRVPFSPDNDLEFSQFFIEHHQMAIDMAEQVLERGESMEVRALAQRIVDEQTEELQTLEAAVSAIGSAQAAPPETPPDPHTEADMEFMQTLSGAELDEMFLLDMIPHHAAGLPPAHRARPRLSREELQTMATNIFENQAEEIGEMRGLLEEMGVSEAGEDRAEAADTRPDFGLEGDRRVPLTPASDLQFVDFFISHHEMAIMMADHEVENGETAEVIALAEEIRTAQTEELETMQGIRAELAGSEEPSPVPADPHADPEMAEMMTTTGVELDRMFLTEMIPHHAAGLPTAHRANPHVQNEELRTLANEMYQAQSEEIGEMKGLLDSLE